MYGREGDENRKKLLHMRSVLPSKRRTLSFDFSESICNSFCKDGRKISVGDCALFKPPQESPPFIGIIRWLTLNKENNILLGVNWLYRPGEVKLGKGILLSAAPNEVFYSFHTDEIPAATLLHQCKVAFLPKGVELPPGLSSFVCWRVYDIASKCLWWLTDQDYINERQEEVDQLLQKTRIEMHATQQPGGRSPKQINGPRLKTDSDNVQCSAASYPSQVKGKKRERGDQGSDSVKRERSSNSKTDDGEPGQCKAESIMKSEIAKITEKGGLIDFEGVEKLVQLMQPDRRVDMRIDLISRSILVGALAATDEFDCLARFLQIKGLPLLDEWLQDVHKGKICNTSGPKDGDKSVEEFLLVLLRALDKLPVNLQALQMCYIGRSVNHLRTHKNFEIQKKARSLVDTWKKRVEAEMNIIDAKSGSTQGVSWSSKSRLPDVSHGGNRHSGGSSEVAMRSSVTQLSATKIPPVKPVQGDTAVKPASLSPGPIKSALSPASGKDGQPRIYAGSACDAPLNMAREEKSSSSSPSHNYSQAFLGKEDARSSTAGSMSVNKISSVASRHRKSINGFTGSAVSGGQRESGSSRSSSLHRNLASEKLSQSGLTCEKAIDVPLVEGNGHKLIVKIPNRGRSPALSADGGSFEDPSIMNSRASSPVLAEKHDQFDHNLKDKSDIHQANAVSDGNSESWQSDDLKDVLTDSDEGNDSPAAISDEVRSNIVEDATKVAEVSKAASSSSGDVPKSGKLHDASFVSINALIESAVNYSEANTPMSLGDDVGMNLLASVAAGEMSKSDYVSPTDSPQRNTAIVEETCVGDDAKSKSTRNVSQLGDGGDGVTEKQGALWSKDGLHLSKHASVNFSGNINTSSSYEDMPAGACNEHFNTSGSDLNPTAGTCLETNEKVDEMKTPASISARTGITSEKLMDGEMSKQLQEEKAVVISTTADGINDTKPRGSTSLLTEDKVCDVLLPIEEEKQAVEVGETNNGLNEGSNGGVHVEKPPATTMNSESIARTDEEGMCRDSCKDLISENVDKFKVEKADEMDDRSTIMKSGRQESVREINNPPSIENQAGLVLAVTDQKSDCVEATVESKDVRKHYYGAAVPFKESPALLALKTKQHVDLRGSKLTGIEADRAEGCAPVTTEASFSAAREPDLDSKLKFDLNEGVVVDDVKYGDPINLTAYGCSSTLHLINTLPLPLSSVSSNLPPSITVAAAAKRPFVPPEDLLRSKGELGWKGSAATSAFRPAEPRKVLDMPLGTANSPLPDATAGKHGRPVLDIDLNVPDERVLEDMASLDSIPETGSISNLITNRNLGPNELMGSVSVRSSGGLGLDLNQVDEANDTRQYSTSSSYRVDTLLPPLKLPSSYGFPSVEVKRDFDLNNGPVFDDVGTEASSFNLQGRGSMQSQPPVTGLRMNNPDIGNFSPWFPPGNYPGVTIPSVLPDRGGHPFPIIAPGAPQRLFGPTGGAPFTPDVYRGSVLPSSPAVPFPSIQFQYPVFPFGASFPLPSVSFSGVSTTYIDSSSAGRLGFPARNSAALVGPAGAVSSNGPRPYVVSLPDGSSNGGAENNRKSGRRGLDLNAGPGVLDIEGRDETLPLGSRQLSVASSQALAEEQARMYQVAGGVLKRKEPDGGWDTESFRYKQSSFQ